MDPVCFYFKSYFNYFSRFLYMFAVYFNVNPSHSFSQLFSEPLPTITFRKLPILSFFFPLTHWLQLYCPYIYGDIHCTVIDLPKATLLMKTYFPSLLKYQLLIISQLEVRGLWTLPCFIQSEFINTVVLSSLEDAFWTDLPWFLTLSIFCPHLLWSLSIEVRVQSHVWLSTRQSFILCAFTSYECLC